MAAQKGDTLTVEGIVVAINSKALGNKYNHLFLADTSVTGGYYCYSVTEDPEELGIKVGMTVAVTGPMEPYSGMQEIKGGQVAILDTTIKTVETVDITEAFIAGTDLGAYVGLPVVIKGVEIRTQDLEKDTSQYLYFGIGEKSGYVRTYVTDFPTNLKADDKATIDADHAAHFGYTADATGILILYNGAPYLIPMSVTPFTNYTEVIKTPAEKVEAEKENLKIDEKITDNTVVTLPLVGQFYNDVTITWTVDNTAFVIGENGKLDIKLGEEKVTITLTATIKCGETTDTATFTVVIDAASTDIFVPSAVTTPAADTAYKFFLFQTTLGKNLYLTGEVDGRYLVTTDKISKAIDVYAETAEGGFKFYILVDGAKQYITVYNNESNKLSVKFDAAGTSVYSYNETLNAWSTVMEGETYYLGTYSNYNTVSASKLSYITAENTGVSQFPAGLATLAPAALAPSAVTTPAADTAYKFFLFQTTLGKNLYLTGEVDGRYLVTTDKISKAIDVYAETAEGGFKFYILVDGAKQYITVYNNESNKLSVKFDAAGTSVYSYNETLNAWSTVMEGETYYLGTYSNYNTVSASKLSYITAENTGVSQFPAGLATIEILADAPSGDDNTGDNTGDDTEDNTGDTTPATGTKYVFESYEAGTQYAANEVHKLDDKVTVTTNDAHFTKQIRLYQSEANNYGPARQGTAIFATTSAIKSFSINAGEKANPIEVYGSTDGTTWTLITTINPTTTYTDYNIDLGTTAYTYIKLAAISGQARVASVTIELA